MKNIYKNIHNSKNLYKTIFFIKSKNFENLYKKIKKKRLRNSIKKYLKKFTIIKIYEKCIFKIKVKHLWKLLKNKLAAR